MKNYFRLLFRYHQGGIGIGTMLIILVCMAGLTSMALGRVWLVFQVSDMQIETAQLQDQALALTERKQELNVVVHQRQDRDTLLAAAKEDLNMIRFPLDRIETLVVKEDMSNKYDLAKVRATKKAGTGVDPGGKGLGVLLSALSSLDRE
jgi:cell division protein FtsB